MSPTLEQTEAFNKIKEGFDKLNEAGKTKMLAAAALIVAIRSNSPIETKCDIVTKMVQNERNKLKK